MGNDVLSEADLGQVEEVVGRRAFERGRAYARQGRVLQLSWDRADDALVASVRGKGAVYEVRTYFEGDGGTPLELIEGACTCPVGYDCKHVAAAILAATGEAG